MTAVVATADGQPIAELELRRREGSSGFARAEPASFVATYVPGAAGAMVVRVDDPTLEATQLQVPVEVYAPDDELRRPETDHTLLGGLAAETGGALVSPETLDDLPALLPNRSVRTISPLRERIWDTPLAFAVFLLLLAGEWVGRKTIRLV